ncbi:hypothetical protein BC940DRAFT_368737 [Gongronella butleri]|nr:hypothetical protein BC940DRAFT_368737 [Gongronella butleri]
MSFSQMNREYQALAMEMDGQVDIFDPATYPTNKAVDPIYHSFQKPLRRVLTVDVRRQVEANGQLDTFPTRMTQTAKEQGDRVLHQFLRRVGQEVNILHQKEAAEGLAARANMTVNDAETATKLVLRPAMHDGAISYGRRTVEEYNAIPHKPRRRQH